MKDLGVHPAYSDISGRAGTSSYEGQREAALPKPQPGNGAVLNGAEYERAIIYAARRGCFKDDEFRDLVYNPLYTKIYSTCFGITKNNADAEDAAQNTLIKISERIGQFSGRSSFNTWVYRIARNEAFMFRRRNKKHNKDVDIGELADDGGEINIADHKSAPQTPEDYLLRLEDFLKLEYLLHRVNNRDGEAIRLRMIGYKVKEISQMLGISYPAAKSRIYRAEGNIRNLRNKQTGESLSELL